MTKKHIIDSLLYNAYSIGKYQATLVLRLNSPENGMKYCRGYLDALLETAGDLKISKDGILKSFNDALNSELD